jgi:2,4-didehydro-3-deoxy-L-rhamnonate hydrolase
MKLIRFGEPGREKPGVFMQDGTWVDVSGFGCDYGEEFFTNNGLSELNWWLAKNAVSAPKVDHRSRVGPPICRPSKIVCIGLNFRDHARESRMEIPEEPVIFFKATTSVVGPCDDLIMPKNA